MTTAPAPLRAVDSAPTFGDFDVDEDGYAVDDTPKCDFVMVSRVRRHGRVTKAKYHLWALAISDAGSALHMLGGRAEDGIRVMRGIESFMRRVLVDDDGVAESATPRFVTDDDVEEATRRARGAVGTGDDDPDDDEPLPIPDDAKLHRLKLDQLVDVAKDHGLNGDGTKADLIAGLAAERKRQAEDPGGELAVFDGEVVDETAQWRLVYPDGTLADDGVFGSLAEARDHADSHPSSKRSFFNVIVSPDEHVELDDLWNIYGHITAKAARRDPLPSGSSSRSRRRRAQKART